MLEENVDEHPELIADLIEARYFTFMRKKYRTMVEGDMFVYADDVAFSVLKPEEDVRKILPLIIPAAAAYMAVSGPRTFVKTELLTLRLA